MRPEGEVRLDRRRDPRGIELVHAHIEPFGWSVHMADAVSAIAVVSGSGTMHCRGEATSLAPGTSRVAAPLELFVLSTGEGTLEVVIVHVPPSLVPKRRSSDTAPRAPGELAEWLAARAARSPGDGHATGTDSDVLDLLADAGAVRRGRVRQGGLEPGPVRRARNHLEAHYGSLPSLDELASAVGTSKFHLVRMFRAYHGVPPHTYLICYRIAIARRMISAGAKGADTALATGFADQSHFSRSFRRMVGMSPVEYARLGVVRPAPRPRSDRPKRPSIASEAGREESDG